MTMKADEDIREIEIDTFKYESGELEDNLDFTVALFTDHDSTLLLEGATSEMNIDLLACDRNGFIGFKS